MKTKIIKKEKVNKPSDIIMRNTVNEKINTTNQPMKEANLKTERSSNKSSLKGRTKTIPNEITNEDKLEHLNTNQLTKAKSNHSEIQIADNQLDISQDIMSNTLKNLQDKMLNSSDFHEESKIKT